MTQEFPWKLIQGVHGYDSFVNSVSFLIPWPIVRPEKNYQEEVTIVTALRMCHRKWEIKLI